MIFEHPERTRLGRAGGGQAGGCECGFLAGTGFRATAGEACLPGTKRTGSGATPAPRPGERVDPAPARNACNRTLHKAVPARSAGTAWLGSPAAWLAVIAAGVVGAAFAKVFLLRAVRRVGGTRTSVLLLSEPIVGTVLAAILLSQGVTGLQVLGGAGVLAGAALAQRPARGRARAAVDQRRHSSR
jgi:hypothetical protein